MFSKRGNKSKPARVIPVNYPFKFMYMDLGKTLALFDHLIRQRGYDVEITPHVICPCVVPSRSGGIGSPEPDCPSCHGQGMAFLEDRKYNTRAIVSGIAAGESSDTRNGLSGTGQFQATFLSEDVVEEGDRLRLTNVPLTVRFNRKYRKNVGGIKLPFNLFRIDRAAFIDPTDRLVKSLALGEDYVLDNSQRLITFPPHSRVDDGTVVAFLMDAYPYFLIQNFLNMYRGQSTFYSVDGREAWMTLPKSAVIARADSLFGQTEEEDVSEFGDAIRGAP